MHQQYRGGCSRSGSCGLPRPKTSRSSQALEAAAAAPRRPRVARLVRRARPRRTVTRVDRDPRRRRRRSPSATRHLAPSDTLADPHLVAALVVAPGPPRRRTPSPPRCSTRSSREATRPTAQRSCSGSTAPTTPSTRSRARPASRRVSEQFQMRVPLPLAESPALAARDHGAHASSPAGDDADWLRVNNRAFHNHPDQGGWAEATLQRRLVEPWFDPAGFLLAFDADGLAGFCWTKVHDGRPATAALGEIYVIGVDPDHQGTGLGRALTVGGLEHLARDRGCPTGMLYVDGANPPALGLYRALGFDGAPHRPRLRVDPGAGMTDPLRGDPRRARRPGSTLPARRGTASTRSSTRSTASASRSRTRPPLPRALRTELAEAFPLALDPVVESTGDDGETVKWLWRCRERRRADRDRPDAVPDPGDRLRLQPGRLRDGLHVLRDRSGRLRAPPRRGRDRRAGRARRARVAAAGATTSCSWGWASRSRTTTRRGPRSSACTATSGSPPATSRSRRSGSCPASAASRPRSLPVTLAISLHAPDDELRNTMIPINRRYPLAEVIDAAAELGAARGRRVTFEYACIAGVNDLPRARARARPPAAPARAPRVATST